MAPPTIVQLVGPSGAGKTLALSLAVRRLTRRGLRLAAVKHSHHPIDLPGKDTDRLRRSGAEFVVFSSELTTLWCRCDPLVLARSLPVDAVLVEGYRSRRLSPSRFTIRSPTQAASVADRIVRAVTTAKREAATVSTEGTGRGLPRPWRAFVGNLMAVYGLRRIELRTRPSPRSTAGSGRGASAPGRVARRPPRDGRRAR